MSNFIKDWTEKEVDLLNSSFQQYSSRVSITKYALLGVIALLILTLLVYTFIDDGAEGIKIEPLKVENESKTPEMQNPRFHGVDSKNQPYNIFAKAASQANKDEVYMREINADITLEDDSWVSLVADSGNYFIEDEFLQLLGEVNIFITDYNLSGYEINTIDADVEINKRKIVGYNKVNVKSDIGNFTAQSFNANLDDQRIFFDGPIKLVINR